MFLSISWAGLGLHNIYGYLCYEESPWAKKQGIIFCGVYNYVVSICDSEILSFNSWWSIMPTTHPNIRQIQVTVVSVEVYFQHYAITYYDSYIWFLIELQVRHQVLSHSFSLCRVSYAVSWHQPTREQYNNAQGYCLTIPADKLHSKFTSNWYREIEIKN